MGGGLQKVCNLSLDVLFFTIESNVFHQPLCRDKQSHYLESGVGHIHDFLIGASYHVWVYQVNCIARDRRTKLSGLLA